VWVDNLPEGFHDFLSADRSEDGNGKTYYGKNPALATRELSQIANSTSSHATFRVTSDQYRHPDNSPDPFEASGAIRAIRADKTLTYVEDAAAGEYRYAQPIFVTQACLKCHGDPEDAPAAVIEKYGNHRAFGYRVGDVRGIISVKLPDAALAELLPALVNPYTIGTLFAALAINFLFSRGLVRRLKSLTAGAESITAGHLDTPLPHRSTESSRDELDHLSHAVDLMRNAIRIALKRIKEHG
jgi:methyl-accepting chemotaxis protein